MSFTEMMRNQEQFRQATAQGGLTLKAGLAIAYGDKDMGHPYMARHAERVELTEFPNTLLRMDGGYYGCQTRLMLEFQVEDIPALIHKLIEVWERRATPSAHARLALKEEIGKLEENDHVSR